MPKNEKSEEVKHALSMPERAYPKCNVYKNADFRYNFAVPVSSFPMLKNRENRHFHENRPYRLAARTQGSHPCNSGSIPDGVTFCRHRSDTVQKRARFV